MLFLLVSTLALGVPDATQSRPERLLAPAEVLVDVGAASFNTAYTRTNTGEFREERYAEVGLRARVEVGILRYLKVNLNVPLLEGLLWQQADAGALRFGDPTIGAAAGPVFRHVHVGALAELTFPVSKRTVLRPPDLGYVLSNRGVVVTTGGISALFGAFVYATASGDDWKFRASARAAYRVRNEDASHAITADLRLELVTARYLLLAIDARFLFPFFGLERSLISPARTSDNAGWIDAGVRAGVRFNPHIDLSAFFTAPIYTFGAGIGTTVGLVATFNVGQTE